MSHAVRGVQGGRRQRGDEPRLVPVDRRRAARRIGVLALRGIVGALLAWMAIDGWRGVYPRWSDVVLLGLAAAAFVNAAVLLGATHAGESCGVGGSREAALEAERWEAFRRYLHGLPAPRRGAAGDARAVGALPRLRDRVRDRRPSAAGGAPRDARGSWPRRARSTGSHPAATSASGASAMSIGDLSSGFGSALAPPSLRLGRRWGRLLGRGRRRRRRRGRRLRLGRRGAAVSDDRAGDSLVERDRPGRRDVERLRGARERDRDLVTISCKLG